MSVLKIISNILNLFMFIFGAYFVVTALFPYFIKNAKTKEREAKEHKFAILIAARNEESVIGDLIKSLKQQNYAKDKYQIFVIPNNCSDKTEIISRECGATIINIPFNPKSKGEVLNYVFNKFKEVSLFDTYVIFDADNLVHPDFLTKINEKLNEGYELVQGFRDCKNPYDSWISGGYAIFYYLQNLFLYQARVNINASATINGTGYAVGKNIIETINYDSKTLTEDIELSTVCAARNIKIGYQEEAIFYDEQVDNFKDSWNQRKRWTSGAIQVARLYQKKLIKSFLEYKNIHSIDMLFISSAYITQFIGIFTFLINLLFNFNLINLILLGIVSYLLVVLVAVYLVNYYKKDINKMKYGILLFPLFIISWMPITIISAFDKKKNWDEIKHNKKIEIKDLIK